MFLSNENFELVVKNTPLVSIDMIFMNSENEKEFLLGQRVNRPAKGYWFVPGGRIQKNETLVNAFERISYSEVGKSCNLSDSRFMGVYEHFYADYFNGEGTTTHYVVLAYMIKVSPSSLCLNNKQHNNFEWMDRTILLKNDTVHQNTKAYFSKDL